MTNPYEKGSLRYNIREKTTELKDLVVDDITQEWQKIPEGARQSISKGAGKFAKDFGTAWEGTKRIDNKYDPTEYAAAGTAYALEGIGAGFDWLTNQVAQKTGIDPAVVAVGEMFVPYSKLGQLAKVKNVSKVKNVQKLNNISDVSFLAKVEKATGQTNLQTQAAQFINTGDDLSGMFTKGSISYNKLDEIRARYPNRSIYEKPTGRGRESRQPFIKEHELESAKAGGKIPYFLGDDSKLYFLDTKKLDQYGPGQHRYAMVDLQNKLANEAAKRATKLSKTIPIEDYILELGEELGTKAFKINKAKMKKLYRWVSEEGAHLDHMWPLVSTPTEGFHHINNLILLYSKHNLKKSNRVLPKALFEELGIPMSKRDLIRSTLEKPKTTNKFKRRRILEELGILEIK